MAAGRFPPVPAGSCLFKPSDFLPTGQRATFVLTSDQFVDDNVGALITVCEGGCVGVWVCVCVVALITVCEGGCVGGCVGGWV